MGTTVVSHKLFSMILWLLMLYTIGKNIFVSLALGDISGIIPTILSILVAVLILKKSKWLRWALIVWAIYLIAENSIALIFIILSHGHNAFAELEPVALIEKSAFLVMGIVVWIGAESYIATYE